MPRQNRVTPTGEIIAHAARGGFMGNRGILHDATGTLHPRRRWAHQNWVCCTLAFKERKRRLMQPGHYTELFFLDEATAFAAGHRPCGQCRKAAYRAFRQAAGIPGPAAALDRQLHKERAVPRKFLQRRHDHADLNDLPDGCFVLESDGTPALVARGALYPYAPEGYGAARTLRAGPGIVLTPPSVVAAFRAGYAPQMALD